MSAPVYCSSGPALEPADGWGTCPRCRRRVRLIAGSPLAGRLAGRLRPHQASVPAAVAATVRRSVEA